MDASVLVDGLTYRGEMSAVRNRYFVFQASGNYLVMSFKNSAAGNFNIVRKSAVDYVYDRFGGKRDVTAKMIVERAKRTSHAPRTLNALNILYILVALGFADYRLVGSHSEMHFSIKKAMRHKELHVAPAPYKRPK